MYYIPVIITRGPSTVSVPYRIGFYNEKTKSELTYDYIDNCIGDLTIYDRNRIEQAIIFLIQHNVKLSQDVKLTQKMLEWKTANFNVIQYGHIELDKEYNILSFVEY